MKRKIYFYLIIVILFSAIIFSNCATIQKNKFSKHNFSLTNTVSIFLLKNEKDYFFCVPIQYVGDYQISGFEFDKGNILIGDYDILLKREAINISVYLNEKANEDGYAAGEHNLIYQEENGKVLLSKMAEPLSIKDNPSFTMNKYDIFIEKYLTDSVLKKIIDEYKKGNVNSKMSVWYDIKIDNEEQNGSGLLDDFELHSGQVDDYTALFVSLIFFRAQYLEK